MKRFPDKNFLKETFFSINFEIKKSRVLDNNFHKKISHDL